MNLLTKIAATACASLMLSGGLAMADCEEITTSATNSTDSVKTPPISKDGSTAPLEVEPNRNNNAAAQPQKDGGNMPLGESKDVATSQQDVEAQQHGEKTAAAKAQDDACPDKG